MAGKAHGKDSFFSIGDAAAVVRDIGIFCDSIDFDRDLDMADSTTIGDEAKEYLAGLDGGGITLVGQWDDTVSTGPDDTLAGLLAAKITGAFIYGPGGNGAARTKYSGAAYVEKYRVSTPLEGVVKFNATLRISGAIVKGVFP
jgi:hypothetical protein